MSERKDLPNCLFADEYELDDWMKASEAGDTVGRDAQVASQLSRHGTYETTRDLYGNPTLDLAADLMPNDFRQGFEDNQLSRLTRLGHDLRAYAEPTSGTLPAHISTGQSSLSVGGQANYSGNNLNFTGDTQYLQQSHYTQPHQLRALQMTAGQHGRFYNAGQDQHASSAQNFAPSYSQNLQHHQGFHVPEVPQNPDLLLNRTNSQAIVYNEAHWPAERAQNFAPLSQTNLAVFRSGAGVDSVGTPSTQQQFTQHRQTSVAAPSQTATSVSPTLPTANTDQGGRICSRARCQNIVPHRVRGSHVVRGCKTCLEKESAAQDRYRATDKYKATRAARSARDKGGQ